MAPAELGQLLPGYQILSLLGRGGMGAVYYAVEKSLDRPVALKLLPAEFSAQSRNAERFTREARALAKLHHPNIVSMYELGTTPAGHLFFTMEFVEGTTLAALIHGPGLNPDQALAFSGQVCDALAYAHEQGVVHRDVKPTNVLVDRAGQAKVVDFGLARLVDPTEVELGHTVTGQVLGTPDYMAPEQKRGQPVDHRADIYSLGVMLYEMLCRQTPQGAFAPPSKLVKCDVDLDRIVDKAMQPAPERRYQSTTEMKVDLDKLRLAPPRMRNSTSRKRAMATLLVLGALAVGIWRLGWHPFGTKPPSPVAGVADSGWRDGFQEFVQGRIRPEFLETNQQGHLAAKRDVQIHLAGLHEQAMRNQVLRMRVRGLIFNVDLRVEDRTTQEARSYTVIYDRASNYISLLGGSPKDKVKLAEGERPRPHHWEKPHELEVRVLGDRISVFFDGRQVIAKRDAELARGHIRVFAHASSFIERLAWIDLGESETIPPLPGWPDPIETPPPAPPNVTSGKWLDGVALLEKGVLRSTAFSRQSDGSLLAEADDAFLDLRPTDKPLLEDQVLRVRLRGKAVTLETRRTEADAGGKFFAFGFRYQSQPPVLALMNPWKGDPAAQQVSQSPPPGFDWAAPHTLTLAAIGDRVAAWLDGEEILTMRRQGPLAGHMAIRAAKDSVIERIEFADLGQSGPPQLGKEETLAGHRYRVVWAHGILWNDAKAQAEQLGGHLVTINSAEEHNLVVRMCAAGLDEMGGGGQFWLGGYQAEAGPPEWRWITNEPFTFTRWTKGKPAPNIPGSALTLWYPKGGSGWNDFSRPNERGEAVGWWIQGYVVEWVR